MTSKRIFLGGVEGGATHSKLCVYSGEGELLSTVKGPGTNHWILGVEETANRLSNMVLEAKTLAQIDHNTPLDALGLSLSGCEQKAGNLRLEEAFKKVAPNAADKIIICSDTRGSVATAAPNGGMVIICGTGSNTLLCNPNGEHYGCGGWGHLLGDEASAYWISHRAIKIVFDDHDNLVPPPHPTDYVWSTIKRHFNITNKTDLLDYCYAHFEKAVFAGLCVKLAAGAEENDPLCLYLFREAGTWMAKTIIALMPKMDPQIYTKEPLKIVCVGSVWLSWEYLKAGFLEILDDAHIPFTIQLVKLTTTSALGSVYLAADLINYNLKKDYEQNYNIFYTYKNKSKSNVNSKITNGN